MPTKFSPTTLLGYIKLLFTLPLLGYVLWHLFTDPGFDAVKVGIQVTAVWGIIQGILTTVAGHYTADADPSTTPKSVLVPTGTTGVVLVTLLAFLVLPLAACKNFEASTVSQTTASYAGASSTAVRIGIAELPANFKVDLARIVARHPAGAADLNTPANGIESLAVKGEALSTPASLQNGVLPWVERLPKIGPIATEAFDAYALAYPTLAPTADTLTAVGEFLRSLEPPKVVTTSAP